MTSRIINHHGNVEEVSAPAFTPGPWEWWDHDDKVRVVEAAEQRFICEVTFPSDARLIAAAPDGYDAAEFAAEIIRMLVAQLATFGVQPACNAPLAIEKLEAFTAKVRGEQQ